MYKKQNETCKKDNEKYNQVINSEINNALNAKTNGVNGK